MLKYIFFLLLFSLVTNLDAGIDRKDYASFLSNYGEDAIELELNDLEFWEEKFKKAPNQHPYLNRMAQIHNRLFNINGKIEHLSKATKLLEQARDLTNGTDSSILRLLAKNYISEHRFEESLQTLICAEELGTRLLDTQKMLFDTYLELGDNKSAKKYLDVLSKKVSFDYLIRKSKWDDHNGNLKSAIFNMELALLSAKKSKNKVLTQWATTNLADYYGHDGQIERSYSYFLTALELKPSDAYAKKGIAWIAYSHEKNPVEAHFILNSIRNYHETPDILLFQAEIAEYNRDLKKQKDLINSYFTMLDAKHEYGNMYNKYNILLLADNIDTHDRALQIAESEVELRPTPESYALLGLVHFKIGNIDEAKNIVLENVKDKTYEPESLFILALILEKSKVHSREVKALKQELLESEFELGPVTKMRVNRF